jgi:hypothetical protein
MSYYMKSPRGPNCVAAHKGAKLVVGDRSVNGRYVKASTGKGTYTIVVVWTLRERRDGKWVITRSGMRAEVAAEWLGIPVSELPTV